MISILSQFHASWVTKTESPLSQVPRPRLRGSRPRPRPRLVKTGLETKTQVSRTPSLTTNAGGLAAPPACAWSRVRRWIVGNFLILIVSAVKICKQCQRVGDFVPQTLYQGSIPGPRWGTGDVDPLRCTSPMKITGAPSGCRPVWDLLVELQSAEQNCTDAHTSWRAPRLCGCVICCYVHWSNHTLLIYTATTSLGLGSLVLAIAAAERRGWSSRAGDLIVRPATVWRSVRYNAVDWLLQTLKLVTWPEWPTFVLALYSLSARWVRWAWLSDWRIAELSHATGTSWFWLKTVITSSWEKDGVM